MKFFIRLLISFLVTGFIVGIIFAQAAEDAEPRALRDIFESELRAGLQPGGSVIVTNACSTKDIDESPVRLPDAKNRMSQIVLANPAYSIVTSSGVTNYMPKSYEPELLRSEIRSYTIDSNKSPNNSAMKEAVKHGIRPARRI